MRVIHGIWARGTLCLWAEDPELPPRAARQSREPRPHPFACQAGELADLLCGLPGPAGQAARKAVVDELTLRLPSAAGGPVASPELVRAEAAARPGRVSLARRWSATRRRPRIQNHELDDTAPAFRPDLGFACVSMPRQRERIGHPAPGKVGYREPMGAPCRGDS